jgi:hypothetical protein
LAAFALRLMLIMTSVPWPETCKKKLSCHLAS